MAPTTNANDDGGDGGSGSSGCGMRYEVHEDSIVGSTAVFPTGFPSLSGYKPVINGWRIGVDWRIWRTNYSKYEVFLSF